MCAKLYVYNINIYLDILLYLHSIACRLSHVRLHETRGIVAHQASLFMGFSRQGYRSRLPFPTLGNLTHPGKHPSGSVNPQLFNLNWWTERPGNCDSWGRKESDMTEAISMHTRSWGWDPNPRGLWPHKKRKREIFRFVLHVRTC